MCAEASTGPTTQAIRSLFSQYEGVDNPILTDYISSIPERMSDAVKRVREQLTVTNTENILSNRRKLAKHIATFHGQAGTNFQVVDQNRMNLQDPSAQILVSIHQPNLFAYGGVFRKIVLLHTLKSMLRKGNHASGTSIKFVNLFLLVDHDFMDDVWIRVAQLPSVRHSDGILELRMPITASNRWKLVRNMEVPPIAIVDHWRKQVTSWIKNGSLSLGLRKDERLALFENLEQFWKEVDQAYNRARSYADLNSFIMSRVVNKIWGYDTLFVRLSDISEVFEGGFNFLLNNFRKYSGILNESDVMFLRRGINTGVSQRTYLNAPVWLHCKCGSKASVKLNEIRSGIFDLSGTCMSCKRLLTIRFNGADSSRIPSSILNELSPRAIPILLLLSRDLGLCCYASGTGGSLGYTMVGRLVFKELSVKMPVTVVWASEDRYLGLGQREALQSLKLKNSAEVIKFAEQLKITLSKFNARVTPLLSKKAELAKDGQDIQDILNELAVLKQEQRNTRMLLKISDKVIKASTLKPCIIDYAVNFGLKNTENMWRNNLIQNDDLAKPITMLV
ncbi:MAG: hypothetical protein WBX01_08535 [Nitrososphaeraceae archaeon]|jgi:hypothetical protein